MHDLVTGKKDFKPKSFWEKPEGTTGMLTIGGIAVGGFFLAKAILPTILSVLDMGILMVGKGITLTALGAVLFAMLYVLTNKQFQFAVSSVFKNAMRKLTGIIIEIDPIGIMKNYIDSLKKKKEVMDRNVSELRGQISVIEQKIQAAKRGHDQAMKTAKVAHEQGNKLQFSLNARSAGRHEKSSMTYQAMHDKMTILYRALKKYQEAVDVTIADLTEEVAVREDERKAILRAHRAMKGAMAILSGGGREKEAFDMAMEFTVNDYGQKIGEIDDFMETTQSILSGIDLQNGVYDASALEKLEAWEAKADSIVLGGEKRLMLEEAGMNMNWSMDVGGGTKVPVSHGDDFNKFFNK